MDLQSSTSERGTAAVIDGSRLLVTPLRRTAVPPPLSAVVLEALAPVLCVTHRHGSSSEVKTAIGMLDKMMSAQLGSFRNDRAFGPLLP